MKLEHYGVIGDLHTTALIGSDGSIDWLCLPRFDASACFAALLGDENNGHWRIAPVGTVRRATQSYRADTLILETVFETGEGEVRVIDFMPPADGRHDVIRIVEGVRGRVVMETALTPRFGYGRTRPWIRRTHSEIHAVAGPDALALRTDVELASDDATIRGQFTLTAGQRCRFDLSWYPAHESPPPPLEPEEILRRTERFWHEWTGRCTYRGPYRDAVVRSLIVLKALTYHPTGGIVAAPTTSLPEQLGGVRNWDYRYCWLRDATLTLRAMMRSGYTGEAAAWGDWLLRAVAGDPAELQMLYGAAGERFLREIELPHLAGYEGARPVRVGNAAAEQFQLDVYGEILDATELKRELGLHTSEDAWSLQRQLVEFVAAHWQEPDEGIWEVRGGRRHFTHSKVMAWVALDRGVQAIEKHGLDGDLRRWREVRDEIHAAVCRDGYYAAQGVFTQYFGAQRIDASLLMMPLVGFLPASDPRMERTIRAIRDRLTKDGLVHRYHPHESSDVDGLPPGEGTFLPCSFWLVECLDRIGRGGEARRLFDQLLTLRTPLGLLAEEYDAGAKRLVGNFPQAFSHVALINAAHYLAEAAGPRDA